MVLRILKKMRLNKNKVLITGGSKGIGLAMAQKFLALDNEVIIIARNLDDLESVKKENSNLIIYQADLTQNEAVAALAAFIKKEHTDLNILVNNAGIQHNYSFLEESELSNMVEEELRINLLSPIHLITALLPVLESNENAAIVNVSSVLGIVPKANAAVYCASKAGLHIFSKSLRYQLNKTKLFELIPPLVDTQMTAGRGKGKISPESLVNTFFKRFEKDKYEISVGKVKLLRLINRISPSIADRIMKGGA